MKWRPSREDYATNTTPTPPPQTPLPAPFVPELRFIPSSDTCTGGSTDLKLPPLPSHQQQKVRTDRPLPLSSRSSRESNVDHDNISNSSSDSASNMLHVGLGETDGDVEPPSSYLEKKIDKSAQPSRPKAKAKRAVNIDHDYFDDGGSEQLPRPTNKTGGHRKPLGLSSFPRPRVGVGHNEGNHSPHACVNVGSDNNATKLRNPIQRAGADASPSFTRASASAPPSQRYDTCDKPKEVPDHHNSRNKQTRTKEQEQKEQESRYKDDSKKFNWEERCCENRRKFGERLIALLKGKGVRAIPWDCLTSSLPKLDLGMKVRFLFDRSVFMCSLYIFFASIPSGAPTD